MPRLFVATWPPPEITARLSGLDRPESAGTRWSVPAQWMVAIRPLGYVEEKLIPSLADVLQAELDGAPAPQCVLGPQTLRPGGDWLMVPVTGLEEIGSVVFEVTEELVPVTHPQPFRTYIVLARGKVPKSLAGQAVSGEWTARSVALVADRSAPRRPRYEDLAVVDLEVAGA
ncbi:MAG TPA: hypothetical protein VHC49_11275 [Mycobacteriales bacterium]|nr:hypothetical protein [Mycobacteriales bacterium]